MERTIYDRRERLKKLAAPISLRSKKTGETLSLGYNKSTSRFGVSITEKGVKDPTLKRNDVSEEEILDFLSDAEFAPELDEFFESLRLEEEAYTNLKNSLLEKLEKSGLSEKEKEEVKAKIELLTKVPSYDIGDHRVPLLTASEGKYERRKYLRVGNEYSRFGPLAVQRIERVVPLDGSTPATQYIPIDFDEMISELKEHKVIGASEEKKVEDKEER